MPSWIFFVLALLHFAELGRAKAEPSSYAPQSGTAYYRGARILNAMGSDGIDFSHLLPLQKLIAETELWACSSNSQLHNLHSSAYAVFRSLKPSLKEQYATLFTAEGSALLSEFVEAHDCEGVAYVARAYRGLTPGKEALEILVREALERRRFSAAALFAKVMYEDWEAEFVQCSANNVVLPLLRLALFNGNLIELSDKIKAIIQKCNSKEPNFGRIWGAKSGHPLRVRFEFAHGLSGAASDAFQWERGALAMQSLQDGGFDEQLRAKLEVDLESIFTQLCSDYPISGKIDRLWIRALSEWGLDQYSEAGLVSLPVENYLDEPNAYSFKFSLRDLGPTAIDAIHFDHESFLGFGDALLPTLLASQVDDDEIIKVFDDLLRDRPQSKEFSTPLQELFLLSLLGKSTEGASSLVLPIGPEVIPKRRKKLRVWLANRLRELTDNPSFSQSGTAVQLSSVLELDLPRSTVERALRNYSIYTRSAAAEILFRKSPEDFSGSISKLVPELATPYAWKFFDFSAILREKQGCEVLAKMIEPSLERLIRGEGDLIQLQNYLKIAQCVEGNSFEELVHKLLSKYGDYAVPMVEFLSRTSTGLKLLQKHYERAFNNGESLKYLSFVHTKGVYPPWVSCEMLATYLKTRIPDGGAIVASRYFGRFLDRCSQKSLENLGSFFEEDFIDFPPWAASNAWGGSIALLGLSRHFPKSVALHRTLLLYNGDPNRVIFELQQILEHSETKSIGAPLLEWYAKHIDFEYLKKRGFDRPKFLHEFLAQDEKAVLFSQWKPTNNIDAFLTLFFQVGGLPHLKDLSDRFWEALANKKNLSSDSGATAGYLAQLTASFDRAPRWVEDHYRELLFHSDATVRFSAVSIAHLISHPNLFRWIDSKRMDEDARVRVGAVQKMYLFGEEGINILQTTIKENELKMASLQGMIHAGGAQQKKANEILIADLESVDGQSYAAAVLVDLPASIGEFLDDLHRSEISLDAKVMTLSSLQDKLIKRGVSLSSNHLPVVGKILERFLEKNNFELSPIKFKLLSDVVRSCPGLGAALSREAKPRFRKIVDRLTASGRTA